MSGCCVSMATAWLSIAPQAPPTPYLKWSVCGQRGGKRATRATNQRPRKAATTNAEPQPPSVGSHHVSTWDLAPIVWQLHLAAQAHIMQHHHRRSSTAG